MSRYTGPRVKVMRALGVQLPGLSRKSVEKRPYPPGQHGHERKKISEYALRLREKQKLRLNYGVSEGQLRRLMEEAMRRKASPGATLVELLERRLDNVVFRAGFARTIPAARQLVCHGHVTVNGRRVDIPSFRVRRGDVVALRESSRSLASVQAALTSAGELRPPWLEVEEAKGEARVAALPEEGAAPFAINTQLVVEYYARA
mgnify:CR=1 FL=1